jgi:hypothetical protein
VGQFIFTRGAGRFVEFAERVNANDPANSAFQLSAWNSTATDTVLRQLDSRSAVEADANTAERLASGWTRKTLDQAGGITVTYDDTNHRTDVDVPDQTWTAVLTGNNATDVGSFYIPDTVTPSAETAVLPMSWHDFIVTTDGSDVTAAIAGLARATPS